MQQDLRTWLIGLVAIVGVGLLVGQLFFPGERAGVPAIGPEEARGHFGVLPNVAESPTNPATPEKVALGKALFFDPRLSKSGFIGCASCHNFALAGADGLPTSVGHGWNIGPRNTPTVLNAAVHFAQFWDGRASDVEEQAGMPILSPGQMAASEALVLERLGSIPQYLEQFNAAFAGDAEPLSFVNVARAIAAFERTLMTPSRFDRFLAGDKNALSTDERAGLSQFVGLGCVGCHSGPALGGSSFQRFGVARAREGLKDLGRFEVTQKEEDRYVFKVPSLRNVGLTAPYFHDGSVWTLEEAVQVMADVQLGKKLSLADAGRIAIFLRALNADPPIAVAVPQLPPSSAGASRPAFD